MAHDIIVKHGGYRRLKSFQLAQLVHDITVRFTKRYVSRFSRTQDQMVQAARSGVQNIAEGSRTAATSKKSELRLTSVARASLEELYLDYEDFLRQNALPVWEQNDPRRKELVGLRLRTADEVAKWVLVVSQRKDGSVEEISANAVLALINVANYLLDRQLRSLADAFEREGGFSERLHKARTRQRRNYQ